MRFSFLPFAALLLVTGTACNSGDTLPEAQALTISCEAENFRDSVFGGQGDAAQVRVESQSNASGGKAVHFGPDSSIISDGIGDALIYDVQIPHELDGKAGKVTVLYSDDVAGNAVALYLDGVRQGSFSTDDTGSWNDFTSSCQIIDLGSLREGTHTLELRIIEGGSYGVILDRFSISADVSDPHDDETAAYLFLNDLVDSRTGLVRSTECEQWTTVYKNALAAMAFIHEGDIEAAERIFSFFNTRYDATAFQGFTKTWSTITGEPSNDVDYWQGDNAFLVIALDYYEQATGSIGNYQEMRDGIVHWLAESGNAMDDSIFPEGLIDMFAALSPYASSLPEDTPDVLLKLHSGFIHRADYADVGDHIERAVLTIGDLSGFDRVSNLTRTDTWQHDDHTQITALSAFSHESVINVEISSQLLLTWKMRQTSLPQDLSWLERELLKMWLPASQNSRAGGLPYLSREYSADHNPVWYDYPMLDPTCYLLFYYWGFNPMVPNTNGFDLNYDFHESEDYHSQTGGGTEEMHADAVNDKTFQIGNTYNEVIYQVNFHRAYNNAKIYLRYSDDVPGNVIEVYVDDIHKGEFTTSNSGGWDKFVWNSEVTLGPMTAGAHTVRLVSAGGTYGVNLDVMKFADLTAGF